ncbi:MAG TPA: DMT family transporter [Symbiobacteriaceae bacterium]|nr:DMT family transporter [Symbiobacteriaceae bacterium]
MSRWSAILTALFVTFLWSTSYILNRWAFNTGIGPLTLAGLRYGVAALSLLAIQRKGTGGQRPPLRHLIGLGVAGYLVAQGFQYVGQFFVTPTQASLVLSVGNSLLALLAGYIALRERPMGVQWLGLMGALGGVLLYYYPWRLERSSLIGAGFILLSGTGYAIQLVANRRLLQQGKARPVDLVQIPMAVGACSLLLVGLAVEPWPPFSWQLLGLILWLGTVNGALAFTLWTWSQRMLQAFESSLLNNAMLLQIALLDVLLLGRSLGLRQVVALVVTGLCILLVQMARTKKA